MENKYAEYVTKVLKEACKEVEMNAERYVADIPFIAEFTLTIRVNSDGDGYINIGKEYFYSLKKEKEEGK